jgi:hypothetical protein
MVPALQREEGMVDFFASHAHPWLLLLGLAVFPRLTLIFVGGPFVALQWLGWVFAPHFLVAFIATGLYWDTNPALCVVAWFIAFAGTGGEGTVMHRANRWRTRGVFDDDVAVRPA